MVESGKISSMESIKWGNPGRQIDMQVIALNQCLRENIRTEDDGTYLYTKWTIDVVTQINPNALAYHRQNANDPLSNLVADETSLPGRTDNAIRNVLMMPRQVLTVRSGGEIILETPGFIAGNAGDRYPCDAKNGPFCEVASITQSVGVMHFVVHCRFTAHVVEYAAAQRTSDQILSNRWVSAENIDELTYPIRYIAGEAIIRTDLMRRANINADDLRNQLFFPVPQNYQRENVKVELSSEGSRLRYSFTDVGKCYNLGATSPVRKIEAYQTHYATSLGSASIANAIGRGLITDTAEAIRVGAYASSSGGIPVAGSATGLAQGTAVGSLYLAGATARTAAIAALDALPKYFIGMRVDLWGDRSASRARLVAIAVGTCMNRLGIGVAQLFANTTEITCRQALHEKFVSVEMSIRFSMDASLFTANSTIAFVPEIEIGNAIFGGPNGGVPARFYNSMARASNDLVADELGQQQTKVLDQASNVGNPTFSDGGSRGNTNLLVSLVSQILQNPNQRPALPAIPIVAP